MSVGKGETTRALVLERGLDLASELGLEGLTIGTLAQTAGLSKSGLYAHFGSKEELQCAVLDVAAERFKSEVLAPAFAVQRGLPRIEAMIHYWMLWETDVLPGGCPFIAAAAEYDDREGPVRDLVASQLGALVDAIDRAARIAVDEGHFAAELDTRQYAFEAWGHILAYQQYARLMGAADARDLTLAAFASLNARAAG